MPLIVATIAAALVFGAMDSLWLRWAGPNLYRPAIGPILADRFRAAPAVAFYVLYIAGMVWFAVRPALASGEVSTAVLNGALLGLLCYNTFDLTSQAVMKVWPTHVTLADMAWGTFATAVASGAATFAAMKLAN